MSEQRDLDRLIDAALDTYAEPSPDANLAGRVLACLPQERSPRPRLRWLLWAAGALPAAICLLLAVYSGLEIAKRDGPLPVPSPQVDQAARIPVRPLQRPTSKIESASQFARIARPQERLTAATVPQPLPKLDVFPAPTPLTPQERALAEYVAQTPQAARLALAQSEQEETPPTVASIHVMPLNPPDEGANKNP